MFCVRGATGGHRIKRWIVGRCLFMFHQINEAAVVQEIHTSLFLSHDLTFSRLCWFIAVGIIDIIALELVGVIFGHLVFPRRYRLKAKE
jgi:hypothetical protein